MFQSSAEIVGSLGDRVSSLLNYQQSGSHLPGTAEETLSAAPTGEQQLQSIRLKLRILVTDGRFDEIAEMAGRSSNDEIISLAIAELKNAEKDDVLKLIASLAEGGSRATVPAINALIDLEEVSLAESIFCRRIENGELLRLIIDGTVEPLSVLEVAAKLEFEDSESIQLFEAVLQCLAAKPLEQSKLFGKVLGDPDPTEEKGAFTANVINRQIKMSVIARLRRCHPLDEERFLWFATRSEDDVVAYQATLRLIEIWQSNVGKVPFGFELYPMLDINLLFYLCQLSASFQWREMPGVEDLFKRHSEAYKQLKETDEKQDKEEYDRLDHFVEQTGEELYRITERRVNLLQPLLNKVSDSLNLPYARLSSTDEPDLCAAYVLGKGQVEINRVILLEDKPLSEEVMSSLLHEMLHMEQDVLRIRMIADDLGIQFGQHRHLLIPLWDRYAHTVGYAPDHIFLLGVLRVRADRPLTELQRRRAQRLMDACYQKNVVHKHNEAIVNRLNKVAESFNALLSDDHDGALLRSITDQRTVSALFQNGIAPPLLLDEVNNSRLEVERIVASLNHQDAGRGKVDVMTVAEELYAANNNEDIALLVERLKVLLLHVLDEEYNQLHGTLIKHQRGGYHEHEAYATGDRVEVIVKALRKGWYRVQ
ncbi:MAG: hypothetical protein C5B53_03505 [Candidatus Melainabacteria bacterium]|nr:MAG: hypothetical protein C5B53_03505 [Candidatus Melainabacteria bacterium]